MTIQYYTQNGNLLGSYPVPVGQPVPVAGTYVILPGLPRLYRVSAVVFVYDSTGVFSVDVYTYGE